MEYISNSGLATLLPKYAVMRREIERRLTDLLIASEYEPLYTPHIGDIELFKTSGHYPYYASDMFPRIEDWGFLPDNAEKMSPDKTYILKPMNCPMHIEAYQSEPRSYKQLPIKYYEFGTVYRNEKSGAVNGLFRLKGFTQDDGHIFCTTDQVHDEVMECIFLIYAFMQEFNDAFKLSYRLSVRDQDKKDKYIGSDREWEVAEEALANALVEHCEIHHSHFSIDKGGAAFYGPKIDFIAKDKLGREWQLGTIQLDFNLPLRFNLKYTASDGLEAQPVMIHRAILGSLERFIAVLMETGVDLPFWLVPEQIRIIPVHEEQQKFANKMAMHLRAMGIRATSEKEIAPLKAKIKKCMDDGIIYRIVVGKKEVESIPTSSEFVQDAWVKIESKGGSKSECALTEFIDQVRNKQLDYQTK